MFCQAEPETESEEVNASYHAPVNTTSTVDSNTSNAKPFLDEASAKVPY